MGRKGRSKFIEKRTAVWGPKELASHDYWLGVVGAQWGQKIEGRF